MPDQNRTPDAERATRNRALKEADKEHHDAARRTPHRAADQDAPEQERPATPDETSDQDIAQLENPPQAEGPRERNNRG